MKTSTFLTSTILLWVASVAQAASVSSRSPSDLATRRLFSRQGPGRPGPEDIPPQCVQGCAFVNEQMANQCPPLQCCTITFTESYVECFVCVATAAGVSDYSDGIRTMEVVRNACNNAGLPVAEAVFPDPPNGPSSNTTSSPTTTRTTPIPPTQTTVTNDTPSQTTVRDTNTTDVPNPTSATNENAATGSNMMASGVLSFVAAAVGVMLM